jgi:hypothetical protein
VGDVRRNGESVGAGSGFKAFYLWACADHRGGTRAYAQFISGSNSTRATACQIWIRPEGNTARFYDCTPMLRVGRYRTYTYPITVHGDRRTQACYRLRYGTGTWTRSYCALSR